MKHQTEPIQGQTIPEQQSIDINKKCMLTIEELSKYTGYSIKYLYKLHSLKKIKSHNWPEGRKLFFCLNEIIEWMGAVTNRTEREIINENKSIK